MIVNNLYEFRDLVKEYNIHHIYYKYGDYWFEYNDEQIIISNEYKKYGFCESLIECNILYKPKYIISSKTFIEYSINPVIFEDDYMDNLSYLLLNIIEMSKDKKFTSIKKALDHFYEQNDSINIKINDIYEKCGGYWGNWRKVNGLSYSYKNVEMQYPYYNAGNLKRKNAYYDSAKRINEFLFKMSEVTND